MQFPKVEYSHLPCELVQDQQYIGQRNTEESFILKCLNSYMANCWPIHYDSYHCKGYTVHQKINNGHYIKAKLRYYKERNKLKQDKLYQFISAYDNLAVFDNNGNYLPLDKHQYIN